MLSAGTLAHGGIMVNYQCTAACRHCLYSCSPSRSSGYVNSETAERICRLLAAGGCRSVHIGGGEPFLDFEALLMMIRALRQMRISLEYIETNAYWAVEDTADEKLERLLSEGARTLCISIDPYHAEYVPYGAPVTLAKRCEKAGMNYFLWKQEYLPLLARLDPGKTYTRVDMETALSAGYIHHTARRYGIRYGGRAVNIEREFGTLHPADDCTADASPCTGLLSTGHFHVDMNCCFIPPGCTGIIIPLEEAVNGIPAGRYAAFEALYEGGISALLRLARQRNFVPDSAGYPSKCNLCFHIRRFLSAGDFPELDREHYEQALEFYS